MATDQEIRDSGLLYVPKQKYLQDPFNLSTPPPSPPPASGGIVNTNAFNNTGNDDFNPAGNAFGYGSPVSEVNVRTFNPQSNDPTGAVADAQKKYNEFQTAPYRMGIDTPVGQRQAKYESDLNNIIQDNRQNYGAQGQYNSPYEDSMELPYQGTLGNKGILNRIRKKVGNVGKFVGGLLPFPLNIATKFLPQGDDSGPGGGSYGIAGLSDDKKAAYNALAGQGYLFGGQNGFKTLTGKNFQATNYVPNQLEMYEKLKDKKELTGFEKKQLLEASAIYKATQAQKQKQKEEFNKPGGTGEQVKKIQEGIDNTPYNQDANIAGGGGGNTATHDYGTGQGQQTAQEAAHDNDSNTGSAQGHNQHYARGGRAGYFFGGRVNYKAGGRISFQGGGSDASSDDFGTSTSAPGPGDTGGEGGNNPSDVSDTQFDGGNNDGASDNPPVTVVNNNPIDISTVTKSVGDYNIPYGVEALMANKGRFKAVINPDDILDKNVGAEFTYDRGPFSIGAYADMDGDKSLNANYTRNNSNYSFDLNDGGGQLKFTRTFANGGLASIL